MGRSSQNNVRAVLRGGAGNVHMVGVCGVGMAGVALLLKKRGVRVTGCDVHRNPLANWLEANGVPVREGHSPRHVTRAVRCVVRTPAVAADAPEIRAARKAGIPVFVRGQVLPELLKDTFSVAVCGTHGKTSTATFVTQLLRACGRDPSWCIGGAAPDLGAVAGTGRGPHLVVEADESDGTLALYRPDVAVVTNIEFDHMEHFANVRAFENCFRTFVRNARRRVVYCADDPRATAICGPLPNGLSYGITAAAELTARHARWDHRSVRFTMLRRGKRLGRIEAPVPGRHNVLNLLAVAAVGLELGLSFEEIQRGLRRICLPRRRFERVARKNGILVLSDYAHHPTEIRALIRTARALPHRRLRAVFQPHRYTRTLALGANFPAAFEGLDELVLTPVYAASEKPLPGGSIWDLYAKFRTQERVSETAHPNCNPQSAIPARNASRSDAGGRNPQFPRPRVAVATSLEQAWACFAHNLRRGDVFLVIGAGDVEKIAQWAREQLGIRKAKGGTALPRLSRQSVIRRDEPLARKTTFGVGGAADVWAEVGSVRDLAILWKWATRNRIPFRILGGGSNVLVSDLGVRGVVARLSGPSFRAIAREGGAIRAGAGVPLRRLVVWAEQNGYGGFEFLEGIPGTVGGALRMNAGAWGREIGPLVQSVRCLEPDGRIRVRRANSAALRFAYRACPALVGRIVLDAKFRVPPKTDRAEIRRQRRTIAARRAWWRGLRCAGSVFRNPPGQYAGRLIEKAGCKGMRVGGAEVSRKHANVLVAAEHDALASDVRALLEVVRARVLERSGVELDPEVVFFE